MDNRLLINGEALSPEKFAAPSKEFGIMPFWFWNGEMSYDEIEYQIREYKAKGCPGFYIHARFGVREELGYMNEAWLDRVKFTIEKAQEEGLLIWIYDEYNWPSGTCGQTLMKDHPEMTNVYLQLIEGDLPGQFFTFMEGTDSRYNDLEQSEPIYACAIKTEDLEKGNYEIVDLMPSLSFDKVITWEAPKGPWKLFYFIERKSSWYADVLNPETTKKFIEYTHELYKNYLQGELADQIGGFFTDEPAMHYFETGRDNFIIPWTKKMFGIFRERNGYDLKKNLPKLFFDCGGDTEQVRYDFWSTLTDQYQKSYFKPIADWCEENKVAFTGHLLYEESLRMHARVDGNLFRHYEHMDVTGVDHLYPRIGTREMENEHVALKLASSAAHQNGSPRLICESLGGSYWDCTMERMKWIGDWEYVLGVNQLIPHGFHYSVEGERKRDWPPSMFYQFTWWEQYGLFNDYMTRLGYVFTGGEHVAKLAVLYPMNSIWANYVPEKRDKIGNAIENDFNFLTDRLLRLHIDFEFLDEDVLADRCEIKDGKICIGEEKYEMLLLPPVTHIKAKTLDTLERFVAGGGKLCGDALLPYRCIEGDAPDFAARIQALFGLDPAKVRSDFLASDDPAQALSLRKVGDGLVGFVSGLGFKANEDAAAVSLLDQTVRSFITPELDITSDEVFYLHHKKDGRDMFFLVNPVEDPADFTISWQGEHAPEIWDLEKGGIRKALEFRIEGGKTSVRVHLEPFGSALYSFAQTPADSFVTEAPFAVEALEAHGDRLLVRGSGRFEGNGLLSVCDRGRTRSLPVSGRAPAAPISLGEEYAFRMDKPNALNTDDWRLSYVCPDDDVSGIISGRADTSGWLPVRMGAWEMQLPCERDDETYPVELWYQTHVQAAFLPDDLKLMIDGFKGSAYTLFVNGREVTETPVRSYLDAEMKVVPLTPYFREGDNVITVRLTVTKKSDGMTDLLKIIGSFGVEERDGRETIVPAPAALRTGDWNKQKLPYYSGTGWYTAKVCLTAEDLSRKLMLKADIGRDVLLIRVNGQDAGTRLWKPYAADLTPLLHEGENTIELGVVNTLMNLLESSHTPSGLMSAALIPYDRYEVEV